MVVQSERGTARFVSKTDYLNYRKCPGFAWMAKFRPEDLPPDADPLSARRTLAGDAVEAMARELFPGGVLIDTLDPLEAVQCTREAIASRATTIFQATVLTAEGLLARADILQQVEGTDAWDLYEVKATTSVDAGQREDASFQALAFLQAGFELRRVVLLHLNRTFVRRGQIDVASMMQATDLTPRLDDSLARIAPRLPAAVAALVDELVIPPCTCHLRSKSQRCPAFAVLHPDIPDGDTIYNIAYITGKTIEAMVNRGVIWQKDWPPDVPLPSSQRRQIDLRQSGTQWIDRAAIARFLRGFTFPLHFLDYETADSAIPQFDGYRPWMKIPFQYSLHVVHENGDIWHKTYLCRDRDIDPVPSLAAQLIGDIGPVGSIVAWNKGFEAGCHITMAEVFPDRAQELLAFNDRLIDLGDVVNKGMWMHPRFDGRWSIKVVLPVAAPDLSYDALEIGNGGVAAAEWARCMLDPESAATTGERETIFAALHRYCELDSLAMVRIWNHVRALASNGG